MLDPVGLVNDDASTMKDDYFTTTIWSTDRLQLFGNSSGDYTVWSDIDGNIAAVLCVKIMMRVKFSAPLNRQ